MGAFQLYLVRLLIARLLESFLLVQSAKYDPDLYRVSNINVALFLSRLVRGTDQLLVQSWSQIKASLWPNG